MWLLRVVWVAFAVAMVTHEVAGCDSLARLLELQDIIEDIDSMAQLEGDPGRPDFSSAEGEGLDGICSVMVHAPLVCNDDDYDDVIALTLEIWNKCLARWNSRVSFADWDYSTNLSSSDKELETAMTLSSAWHVALARVANSYKNDVRYGSLSEDTRRQIRLLAYNADPSDPEDVKKLVKVHARLEKTYSTAKVQGLSLEPDLTRILQTERDPSVLLAAWWGWRDATGPRMRDDYEEMVALLNKGARENNFPSYAEAWIESQFDQTANLETLSEDLWSELEPLYQEVHAYVRERLRATYTGRSKTRGALNQKDTEELEKDLEMIFDSGGIPAHLTGNMWAQNWQNIYELVKPFDVPEVDYNRALLDQNYTVDRLFTTAEEFYTSIGLFPMTDKFNRFSMKVKPNGTEVVCHASASDLFAENDFRIKMCTEVTMEYFETIHHEMGHIEYFMAYSGQPAAYRDGANSGFHEAIGDTVSLSVLSNKHLKAIGLAPADEKKGNPGKGNGKADLTGNRSEISLSEQRTMNYLMEKALFKISFLPFGYMIDKWRWDVFRGKTTKADYNRHWWDLRLKYQGIVAPVSRSERDFDPGAKFHIPSNSPYICYFISFIIQFQFYEAMCDASGHQGPLYDCDFYQSIEAGTKLKEMLQLGKSVPWPSAMDVLTGTSEISTKSILRYFEPLYDWLKEENKKNGVKVGWKNAKINWKD